MEINFVSRNEYQMNTKILASAGLICIAYRLVWTEMILNN